MIQAFLIFINYSNSNIHLLFNLHILLLFYRSVTDFSPVHTEVINGGIAEDAIPYSFV